VQHRRRHQGPGFDDVEIGGGNHAGRRRQGNRSSDPA
jgi:hypothetical protein